MFTGIIEEIGHITEIKRQNSASLIRIKSKDILEDAHIDDSISVQGVCLSIIKLCDISFDVFAVEETVKKTTIGQFRVHQPVNLERAMLMNGRFGGHLVLGHVDGRGKVLEIMPQGSGRWMKIEIPQKLIRLAVDKGSITIDGVSLTIAKISGSCVWISLIPHTLQKTTLQFLKIRQPVNIEMDVIGKYIERMMPNRDPMKNTDWSISTDFEPKNSIVRNEGE